MAAYIIMRFLIDITGSISNYANLDSYKHNCHAVYYCFILPVTHTMMMMMNIKEETDLSMSHILSAFPRYWYKKIRNQIAE